VKLMSPELKFATKAIHGGYKINEQTGEIVPAIHLSTTFKQFSAGNPVVGNRLREGRSMNAKLKGFEYSRSDNPGRQILEKTVAKLENAAYGLYFSIFRCEIQLVNRH
jgi:cystathionine gamma-lyase